MPNYYHWSAKPIDQLDYSREYKQFSYKPRGFWFSVENAWQVCCQSNGYRDTTSQYKYRVDIHLDRVYKIATLEDLRDFNNNYDTYNREWKIHWFKVTQDYDGIVIYNYADIKQRLRQENDKFSDIYYWFYDLDCSSGCIWNLRAITNISSI